MIDLMKPKKKFPCEKLKLGNSRQGCWSSHTGGIISAIDLAEKKVLIVEGKINVVKDSEEEQQQYLKESRN